MNWSSTSSTVLWLELRGSRGLAVFISCACGLAIAAVAGSALPELGRAWLAVALLGWGLDALHRHVALAGPRAVRAMCRSADGAWRLCDGAGRWQHARLQTATCLGPGLCVLRWRDDRGLSRVAVVLAGSAGLAQRTRLARDIIWRPAT